MAKFTKDEVFYYARVYSKTVKKCVIENDFFQEEVTEHSQVLVAVEGENHPMYVPVLNLYYSKKNAEKRIKLEKALYNLRNSDSAERITDKVLGK